MYFEEALLDRGGPLFWDLVDYSGGREIFTKILHAAFLSCSLCLLMHGN